MRGYKHKAFALLLGLLVLAAISFSTGCATGRTEVRDLAFLQDGVTKRTEVLEKLGTPSGKYDEQRFLTYRFGKRAKGGYITPGEQNHSAPGGSWYMLSYSLVLVFDDGGVLKNHKLVKVD